MKRGVVLSADLDSIIVFSADCKLVRIPNRHNVKIGQEISFESAHQAKRSRSLYFRPLIAFALAIVAVFTGLLIANNVLMSRTYAIISIDINPSIQFVLNNELKVTDVVALNENAQSLLVREHFIDKTWDEATLSWLTELNNNGYDHLDNVLISAIVPHEDTDLIPVLNLDDRITTFDFLSEDGIHFYYSHDFAVAQEAQSNGISVGHQMVYNQYLLIDDSLTLDDLFDKPLGERVRFLAQNGGMNQTETTASFADTPAQTRPGTSSSDHPTETIPSQPSGPPETIPSQPSGPPETVPSQPSGPPETVPSQPSGPPETVPSQTDRPNETRPTNPRSTESGKPTETPPSNPRATEQGQPSQPGRGNN